MLALAAFALCLARGEANRGFALGLRAVRTGSPPDDDAVPRTARASTASSSIVRAKPVSYTHLTLPTILRV